MKDKILKIHHSSQELSKLTSMIDSCKKILSNKNNKDFQYKTELKVKVSSDKAISDGGFTNLNIVELLLNKNHVLEIAEVLIERCEIRIEEIFKEINNL